jgi:DNA repair protein RecO (recombination protein O)
VQVKTKAIVLSSLKFQEKSDCKMFYAVSRFEIVFCSGCFFRKEIESKNRLFPTILEIEAVHKTKAL